MHKYKIGDKVRMSDTGKKRFDKSYDNPHDEIGTIIVSNDGTDFLPVRVRWSAGSKNSYDEIDLELATPPRQIELGGTYVSKNGDKWECIAVKGDVAWLAGFYSDGLGTAYRFNIDGSPICLGSCTEYRIIFPPVIEDRRIPIHAEGKDVYLTYTVKDGEPDWDTAKVLPCD